VGVKRPGREADHSPLSSDYVKNVWSYASTTAIRLHGAVLSRSTGTIWGGGLPDPLYTFLPDCEHLESCLTDNNATVLCTPRCSSMNLLPIESVSSYKGSALTNKRT